MIEYWIPIFFALLINGLIFGAIANYISEARKNGSGFVWGFFLGIIGIFIVGFLPEDFKNKQSND